MDQVNKVLGSDEVSLFEGQDKVENNSFDKHLENTSSLFDDEEKLEIKEQEVKQVEDVESNEDELQEVEEQESTPMYQGDSSLLLELSQVDVDYSALALGRLESEAETISNYVKALIKDLHKYEELNDKKDKISLVISSISGKIKVINSHSLELKNLLVTLEDHYYSVVIDALEKINKKANSDDIDNIINSLKEDLRLIKQLDTHLIKVMAYHDLLNVEKNSSYKEEIAKQVENRILHGDLNELLDKLLIAVVNKSLSIKNKIERNNPLELAKRYV